MVKVLTNGSRDRVSIPYRAIPNTQKMVFDAFLLILMIIMYESKVMEQSREKSCILPYSQYSSY